MYIPLKPLFSRHKGIGVQFSDEPTGNLDTATSHDVIGLLKMLSRQYQQTLIVDKLAELYGVPVDDLLDDYNRFLYKGQGKMIREYRESLGLKKKPFARLMGISPNLLRAWEDHQKRMNINSWNKYFKGKIKA